MTDKTKLLLDSNVVINYDNADILCVLSLVNKHIGQVYILTAVLEEVGDLSDVDCARRGFEVIETTPSEMILAGKLQVGSGPAEVDDQCLAVAQKRSYICVTNDRVLRRSCDNHGVNCRGGLGLLILLCEKQQITTNQAKEYADKLSKTTRRLGKDVKQKFHERLKQLANRPRNTAELPTTSV